MQDPEKGDFRARPAPSGSFPSNERVETFQSEPCILAANRGVLLAGRLVRRGGAGKPPVAPQRVSIPRFRCSEALGARGPNPRHLGNTTGNPIDRLSQIAQQRRARRIVLNPYAVRTYEDVSPPSIRPTFLSIGIRRTQFHIFVGHPLDNAVAPNYFYDR